MINRLVVLLAVFSFTGLAPLYAETTSMAKLIALGQSVVCTYSKNEPEGSQSGTIYVAENKMSGDVSVTSEQGNYLIHMLRDGEWQYVWGGPFGDAQGMKMAATQPAAGPAGEKMLDADEEMNFECRPWAVDSSRFVVPAGVQFTSMDEMIPPDMRAMIAGGGAGQMAGVSCAACDQAPEGQPREQCRAMLGC